MCVFVCVVKKWFSGCFLKGIISLLPQLRVKTRLVRPPERLKCLERGRIVGFFFLRPTAFCSSGIKQKAQFG